MSGAQIDLIQTGPAPENLLLVLGVILAVAGAGAVALSADRGIDRAVRAARTLYFRRRAWGWRLAWLLALPTLGPLAAATSAVTRAGGTVRHRLRTASRGATTRRRPVPRLGDGRVRTAQ